MEFNVDFCTTNLGAATRNVADILGRNFLGLKDLDDARKSIGIDFDASLLVAIIGRSNGFLLFENYTAFSVKLNETEARRLSCFDYDSNIIVELDFFDVSDEFHLSAFLFDIIYVAEKHANTDTIKSVRVDAQIKKDLIYNKWIELGCPSTLFVKRDGRLTAE